MSTMVNFESIPAPIFDGSKYSIWSYRMEVYLSVLGYDVWMFVVNGYSTPTSPHVDPEAKIIYDCNAEAMKAILSGLSEDVSSNLEICKYEKRIWDGLKKLYGDEPCTTMSDSECKKKRKSC